MLGAYTVMNRMLAIFWSLCWEPRCNTAPAKQRNGGPKKLIGSGTGYKDAGGAAHEPKMQTATTNTTTMHRGKPGAQRLKAGFAKSFTH
jgi:hypothetical protein